MSDYSVKRPMNVLISGATAVLLGVVVVGQVLAAVPVEESRSTFRRDSGARQDATPNDPVRSDTAPLRQAQFDDEGAPPPGGAGSAGGDAGRLSGLFYQLQVLQQEVQELRGQVEEQSHQLDRLTRDQQEQYLDLDRRMQALRGGDASAAQAAGSGAKEPRAKPAKPRNAGSGDEREAYTAAFELMKQRQFQASADAFNRLVVDYPNGAYTPNAFYWLGELYLAQDDNEKARQSFAQVVNLYPDHQKVPDALYKLGVVYHRLGDVTRAREYLNRVRTQHPQSSAAGLAQTYLAEL